MKPISKHQITALIRSAKPTVHPDTVFVSELENQLQHRAVQLRVAQQHTAVPQKKPWFLWSGLSLGAALAVMAVMIFMPPLLKQPTQISGYIQKGPFINGTAITVQALDKQLQPTGQNYQITTTSDFGDYRLKQKIDSQYVEVIAQGYYYNEVSGELSAAPLTLRAVADISTNKAVNVNILTTLTNARIRYLVTKQAMTFAEAKQQAETEVLTVFNITTLEKNAFEVMNISKSGDANGILLAASVIVQGEQSVAELSELLAKISLDLKPDGTIEPNSALITTLKNNATKLNTYNIRRHLESRFKTLAVAGTVPPFEQYIEPFALSATPFTYRIHLLDNIFGVNKSPQAKIKITIYGTDFVRDRETVELKNLFAASNITYINDKTLVAEFPIETLSAGSYTVVVKNKDTGRTGVTDGEPLETKGDHTSDRRLLLRGYQPTITRVTGTVSYLNGGTITIEGAHLAYGTFVWINGWQVPAQAVRVANDHRIDVDLSAALIVNNEALPRKQALTITVQTPDFQTAESTDFKIE